jgi:hypothetical protein
MNWKVYATKTNGLISGGHSYEDQAINFALYKGYTEDEIYTKCVDW